MAVAVVGTAAADPSTGRRYVGAEFATRSAVHARSGAAAATNALAGGVAVDVLRRGGTFFGGYQGIRRNPVTGVYEAASEMRLDGAAAGY